MNTIDAKVYPQSRMVKYYSIGYLFIVNVMGMVITGTWWVGAILLIFSVITYMMIKKPAMPILHITSPNVDNFESKWQILFSGRNKKELWEMELTDIKGFGNFIQLKFNVVHPMPSKKTIVLWRDQVKNESWRRLQVLSRW